MASNLYERSEKIDYLRGLAVLLVMLGHSGMYYGRMVLPFHMPLFFFISGYLGHVYYKEKRPSQVISDKARRLLIPYLSFEILHLLISYASAKCNLGGFDIFEGIKSILLCLTNEKYPAIIPNLWFFPCLFFTELFFLPFRKNCYESPRRALYFSMVFLCLSYINSFSPIARLPFTVDIALMGASFYCLGFYGVKIESWLINDHFSKAKALLMVISGICTVCIWKWNAPFYMYDDSYGNYIIAYLGAIAGSVAFAIAAAGSYQFFNLRWLKAAVCWLGRNSLGIFPIHLEINWIVQLLYDRIHFAVPRSVAILLADFLLIWPMVTFYNKYAPLMVGKIARRKKG